MLASCTGTAFFEDQKKKKGHFHSETGFVCFVSNWEQDSENHLIPWQGLAVPSAAEGPARQLLSEAVKRLVRLSGEEMGLSQKTLVHVWAGVIDCYLGESGFSLKRVECAFFFFNNCNQNLTLMRLSGFLDLGQQGFGVKRQSLCKTFSQMFFLPILPDACQEQGGAAAYLRIPWSSLKAPRV